MNTINDRGSGPGVIAQIVTGLPFEGSWIDELPEPWRQLARAVAHRDGRSASDRLEAALQALPDADQLRLAILRADPTLAPGEATRGPADSTALPAMEHT